MDLIYTDENRIDQGILGAYNFDLSFGSDENDFELTLGANEPVLAFGDFVYIEGTEYGGIIDARKTGTDTETITYMGRTFHGILQSKIIEPDAGQDYYTVSGDASEVLSALIERFGISELFIVESGSSVVSIASYQFERYCKGYDGIRDMLTNNGAKLQIRWKNRKAVLSAVPVTDYTQSHIDSDMAALTVEQHAKKVNHLICLGSGELAKREVLNLYADQFGNIGDTQYYTGIDEIAEIYDFSAVATYEELRSYGEKRLKELRDNDTAEISFDNNSVSFDIGDIVGAEEIKSGVTVAVPVTQKIVTISNGIVTIDYKTGKGEKTWQII